MKPGKLIGALVLCVISIPVYAQVLSSPGGTVSDNGTVDQVWVNGQLKASNPSGRSLVIEREDADPFMTFHDPGQYWYSMGIDRSNNGVFILNNGGELGTYPHFVMNSTGAVGLGVFSPANELDVNGRGRFRRQGSATSGFVIGGDALSLHGWGTHNPYIEWINSNGVRQGYFGWNTNRLSLVLENSHNFTVENGNVGIGTTTPSVKLEVKGNVNVGTEEGTDTGYGAVLQLLGAALNGDRLWLARYNNGSNQTELRVNIGDDYGQAEDMFVVGTHYWNGGAWHPHLAVQASGNVGIGTTNTQGYRLAVAGKTITEEVVVKLKSNWPDYVFEPSYNLLPLSELERFIKSNKHLPDVPAADDVKQNGLSLGEMNAILLKKVEELTLHLININKRMETLEAENNNQKNEIESLKKK